MNRNREQTIIIFFRIYIPLVSIYRLHLLRIKFFRCIVSLSTLYGIGTRKVPPCVMCSPFSRQDRYFSHTESASVSKHIDWRKRFFSSREGVSRRRQSVQRRCSSLSCSSLWLLLLSLMVNSRGTILASYYPHKMCKCPYYRPLLFSHLYRF